MIVGYLVWYYLGKYALIIFTIICFYFSVSMYNSATKFYFPKMKDRELQHFHDKYPEFIRTDLPYINLGRILFHTFSFLIIKIVLATIFTCAMSYSLKFVFNKSRIYFKNKDPETNFKEEDLPWIKFIVKMNWLVMYSMGVLDLREKQQNPIEIYRKYLGPDYTPPSKYTTIILNHTNWVDILYPLAKFCCSFVSKDSVRNYFQIGYIARAVRCLFLDRTSKENRIDTFNKIIDTQNKIMEGKVIGSLCIFPEGSTSNGDYLLEFKKGSFASLTPVKPFYTKGSKDSFQLAFGCINISIHCYLTLCFLYHRLEVTELPVIAPTEYLFENYKHLGHDKVEIYQEAVKAIYSEASGLKISKSSFQQKLNYLSEIKGKIVKNT